MTRVIGCAMIKYMGHTEGCNRYYDSDVIVFLLADAYLLLAEVENGPGNYIKSSTETNSYMNRKSRIRNINPFCH